MKALILAAGYATRLYPLTKQYPKPLLKLGSRPIIDYIIDKLKDLDKIDEIIVVTNSKFFSIFKKWRAKIKSKKRISLVDDLTKSLSDKRGAVGDMHFAIEKKQIRDDLFVMGGDNIFAGNLRGFFNFTKKKKLNPVIGVYNINKKDEAKKYGVVKLDSERRVVDFQEKSHHPKSALVAMCLYYFPKEKLGFLKEYVRDNPHSHDAAGFYINWLRKRVAVYGFTFKGSWYDIGDHKYYNKAKRKFK